MHVPAAPLLLVGISIATSFGLLQVAFWLLRQHEASLWWAAADGVGTVGALLILPLGWMTLWITQSAADTAIFASGLLLWLGYRRVAGQPLPLRTFAAFTFVFFLVDAGLRLLVGDLTIQMVFVALALALVNGSIAVDLSRAPRVSHPRLRVFLVALFVLQALFYLFRGTVSVTIVSQEILRTSILQGATVLLVLVKVVWWNVDALCSTPRRHRVAPAIGV